MNRAATHTLRQVSDITFAYGVSDEYSFVFDRHTTLFERRRDKLCSTVVSTFTAAYMYFWDDFFSGDLEYPEDYAPASDWIGEARDDSRENEKEKKQSKLNPSLLPSFDARAILYPTTSNLRDYLSWRQVDCHINNLYNTTFWFMVCKGGMSEREAEQELKGTVARDKNEILWGRYGVNYNGRGEWERKGGVVYRDLRGKEGGKGEEDVVGAGDESTGGAGDEDGEERGDESGKEPSKTQREKLRKARLKATIVVEHVDIIKDEFWEKRPWILGGKAKMGKG
jgi:tRNA(His) guanylyltransferase